jgi:hypothetical protein
MNESITQNDIEITFSLITNSTGYLTKTIQPDGKGSILKKPAADMSRGYVQTIKTPFEQFGAFIRNKVNSSQAISHGIVSMGRAAIVTVSRWNGGKRFVVARTKKHFKYPEGTAIGMLDHDPKPGQQALPPQELSEIIVSVWPGFATTPTWTTPSTSSCITALDGTELTSEGHGYHMYFVVRNGAELPVLSKTLFARLWLAGHGYIFISKDGKQLLRTVFDATVFSPERLDFVAGAHCVDCVQNLPEPVYKQGIGPAESIAPLTNTEQASFEALVEAAKTNTKAEAETIRVSYIEERAPIQAKKQNITVKKARENIKARIGGKLPPDDIIVFRDHGETSVADVLQSPWIYDGESCLDPLEPEEGHGRALFYANTKHGNPQIFSQLHGGRTFKLKVNRKKTRRTTVGGGRYGRK